MSDEVEVIADTLGRSVEHSLLAFHDSALCLSVCPTKWLLGVEWKTYISIRRLSVSGFTIHHTCTSPTPYT